MSMFEGLFGTLIWSKIGVSLLIVIGLLVSFCTYQHIMIKSYKMEINNLQTDLETCRANLKGAEDAAFNTWEKYEVLKDYMDKLGKNVINMDGNIDEKEFNDLLNEIKGKRKQ